MSDQMLFVLANLKVGLPQMVLAEHRWQGSHVNVLTTAGECWEGVFTAFSPENMDFALRFARKVSCRTARYQGLTQFQAEAPATEPPFDTLAIQVKDLARIMAHDIPLGACAAARAGTS